MKHRKEGKPVNELHKLYYSDSDNDNHSDQLNPNNDSYWQARGYDERPSDWRERHRRGE